MFSLYSVFLLATAVSAGPRIAKRDVATVLANLENIDTQTNSLTAAINAWDASALGALGIQQDVTNLEVCYCTYHFCLRRPWRADDHQSRP